MYIFGIPIILWVNIECKQGMDAHLNGLTLECHKLSNAYYLFKRLPAIGSYE